MKSGTQNPILDESTKSSLLPERNDAFELKISCIEEERLGLGINDYTELIISPDSNNSDPIESPLGPFKVIRVDNSKSVVISIDVNDKNNNKNQLIDIQKIISAVKQGRVTMKKVKIVKLNSLLNFYDYFLLLFYSILSNEIFRIVYIYT